MPLVSAEVLSAEHAAIEKIANQLMTCVLRHDRPPPELGSLRWRLQHMLAVHLAKEDRHLYPKLKQSADSAVSALAVRMEREMGDLADAFMAYGRRWDAKAVHDDWEGFRNETQTLLNRLRHRIVAEERHLYPRMVVARAA